MTIHGDEMRVCPEIYKQLLPTGLSMGFMISFVSIGSLATFCGQNLGAGRKKYKTPLVSSFIELAGKVLIAFFLTPVIGYFGIIISEPIVWVVMILPLFAGMRKFGVLSETEL